MTNVSRPAKGLFAAMVLCAVAAFGLMALRLDSAGADAAEKPCNRIYGTVFQDTNVNGNLDVGEPGILNATLRLYNLSDVLLQTTSSNSVGYFEFSGVGAGDFEVRETNAATHPGHSTPNIVQVFFGTTCFDSDSESETDFNPVSITAADRVRIAAIIGSPQTATMKFGDLLPPPPAQTQSVPNLPAVTPVPTKTATATATATASATATATATNPATATASPTSAATATATPTSGVGGVGGTGPGSTGGAQPTPKAPTAGSGLTAEPANPLFWVIILLGASVLCGTAGAGMIASGYRRK